MRMDKLIYYYQRGTGVLNEKIIFVNLIDINRDVSRSRYSQKDRWQINLGSKGYVGQASVSFPYDERVG